MSRNLNPRGGMRKEDWLGSEVAPFIRRILKARTDDQRTAIALEWADWLEAHGDRGDHAKHLRNPWIQWKVECGIASYFAPHLRYSASGIHCRVDWFWWVCYYPTAEWLASDRPEYYVRKWVENHVELNHDWIEGVANRIGLGAEVRRRNKLRAEFLENHRLRKIAEEKRDREEYARLWKKFGGVAPDTL